MGSANQPKLRGRPTRQTCLTRVTRLTYLACLTHLTRQTRPAHARWSLPTSAGEAP